MSVCYICLNVCNRAACTVCSLKVHNLCINRKILYERKNGDSNDNKKCPQCKQNTAILPVYSIVKTRQQNNKERKLNLIKEISTLLHTVEISVGRDNKLLYSYKLFNLLKSNKWFLKQHKNFQNAVKKKLIELNKEHPPIIHFYYELFGTFP